MSLAELSLPILCDRTSQFAMGIHCVCLGVLDVHAACLLVGSGNLNCDPHAFVTNTLPMCHLLSSVIEGHHSIDQSI